MKARRRISLVPIGCAGMVAILSATARADFTPGLHSNLTLTHDAATRYYDVYVPTLYDGSTALPLVVDLHAYGTNKTLQRSFARFDEISEVEGFLVAYPLGRFGTGSPPEDSTAPPGGPGSDPTLGGPTWNAAAPHGQCCGEAAVQGVDDVGFLRAMVAAIEAEANIDAARVYATGLSNGGAMAQRLACEAADLFAAAAPVAFPIPFVDPTVCQPARPMPILTFQGTTDQLIPYLGGPVNAGPFFSIVSAQQSFERWRLANGCVGSTPDLAVPTGPDGICEYYTSCQAGVEVGLCSLVGTFFFDHIIYSNTDGLDVEQTAWDFVSQFTLPSTPTPTPAATSTPTAVEACPALSDGACTTGFAKGLLLVKSSVPGKGRLVAKLLEGPASVQTDMGNPIGGDTIFSLCVYDDDGVLVGAMTVDRANDTCSGKPCWKSVGKAAPAGKGYKYIDKAGDSDGVRKLLYKGGAAGKSKALAKGKGSNLPAGMTPALGGSTSATVQLRASDGACLSLTMPNVKKNEAGLFKAKAP